MSDPSFNDDSFANDSSPPERAGEADLDQLLAEVSHQTAALQKEVAGDSADARAGHNESDGKASVPGNSNAEVEIQIADVEALVLAARAEVGAEIEDDDASGEQSALPLGASENAAVGSAESPGPPDRPTVQDAGTTAIVDSEYTTDLPLTRSDNAEVDTPDRADTDDAADTGRPKAWSLWGRAGLDVLLNLVDLLDRRMGWLGSGTRRVLGVAAFATFVTAVALWVVSFVVEVDVPS